MDKYFYSLECDDYGYKVIHLLSNVYFNDADGTEKCYRIAEWTWFYIDVNEAQLRFNSDTFFDYANERITYLQDATENEAIAFCEASINTKLHILDIKEDTPLGLYWFE